MKTCLIFLVFFTQALIISAQVTNDTLLFKPEIGKEYKYEITESKYIRREDGTRLIPFDKIKVFDIKFEKSEPDNEEVLIVSVERNFVVSPGENPIRLNDYKFPGFIAGYNEQDSPDYFENLFCLVDFKYEFDLNTSKIRLVNRDEILIKVNEILIEKGFDEAVKRRQIRLFNEDAIDLMTSLVQSIYRVPNNIVNQNAGNYSEYNTQKDISEPNTRYTQKRDKQEVGQYSFEMEYNHITQSLIRLNSVKIDSLKRGVRTANNKYYELVNIETDISLKSIHTIGEDQLKITGVIQNHGNKKVTVGWLKKPFGTTLFTQSIFLDENNSFQFEVELEHPQIVYVQIGNGYSGNKPPIVLLYAEPGSEIEFDANIESSSTEIHFSGDFQHANEMINAFRIKHPIFDERFQNNSVSWYSFASPVKEFEHALNEFSEFFESYKAQVDKNAWEFIKHETEAQLMTGAIDKIRMYNFSVSEVYPQYFPDKPDFNKEYFVNKLNSFEAVLAYNQYGLQSRIFADNFLDYTLSLTRKIRSIDNIEFSLMPIFESSIYLNDIDLQTEFAKTVLAGPALYNELATNLFQHLKNSDNGESLNDTYTQNKTIEYFRLMLRLSNDEELNREIKNIISTHMKWQNDEYVPDTKFVNPQGKEIHLKDFFGEKPTIFYISRDWSVERYFFDDLSVENPEINYVLIVEGSNFKEWTDYLSQAHPKAFQLLLMDSTQHLPDIFSVNYQSFILFDENGSKIGYGTNPLNATQQIKEYLEAPKEKQFNKSQFQIIILVLLIVLTVFIIGMIIWKWRVRQQLNSEAQKRRLRELELTAIRSQMNPHFLFNSLNSVQNLIQQNKGREAHLYLSDFAGLIRKVLKNSEKEEVSLAEELEMTKQYLSLEKLRFDFNFNTQVDETIDTNNTLVPCMMLQPFVENAIIHGLQNKENNRQLKIAVEKVDSAIKISVEDNGIGRNAAARITKEKNGKGSKLIKERFEILSQKLGEKYSVQTIDLEEGTRVEITIPEEK